MNHLRRNEIQLYFAYPEQITDSSLLRRYKSLLSDDELAQMPRYYFARHRHQYLVTRALIRSSLSNYYPVDPVAWRFDKNSFGKPQIGQPDKTLPIRFNLSHCDGMIVCGIVRDYDIGVDVEDSQRSTRAALTSLSSYFSTEEIEALEKLPTKLQKQRFFDYWTLKESYIKARGMGLAIPLRKFSFKFHADKLEGISIHPDLGDNADDWQFWRIPMDGRYRVAVAVSSGSSEFKLRAVKSVPLQSNDPIHLNFI